MHVDVSFLCQAMPESLYIQFDENGSPQSIPYYRATHTATPLSCSLHEKNTTTFWALSEHSTDDIKQALTSSIKVVVCSEDHYKKIIAGDTSKYALKHLVVVPDSNKGLVQAATLWRTQKPLQTSIVAGSRGKREVVNFLSSIFSQDDIAIFTWHARTIYEAALGLLHLVDEHVSAFFSLEAHIPGALAEMTQLISPAFALITNISHVDYEVYGSIKNVAQEIKTVFDVLPTGSIGFINGDDRFLVGSAYPVPVVKYGTKKASLIRAHKVAIETNEAGTPVTSFHLHVYDKKESVLVKTPHEGALYSALAATALSYFLHVPLSVLTQGIATCPPLQKHYSYIPARTNGIQIIDDSSDTTPEGVKAALSALHATPQSTNKIAILDGMNGLGDKESFWHRQIGRDLSKTRSINHVILIGERAARIARTAPLFMHIHTVQTAEEASRLTGSLLSGQDDLILVKADGVLDTLSL